MKSLLGIILAAFCFAAITAPSQAATEKITHFGTLLEEDPLNPGEPADDDAGLCLVSVRRKGNATFPGTFQGRLLIAKPDLANPKRRGYPRANIPKGYKALPEGSIDNIPFNVIDVGPTKQRRRGLRVGVSVRGRGTLFDFGIKLCGDHDIVPVLGGPGCDAVRSESDSGCLPAALKKLGCTRLEPILSHVVADQRHCAAPQPTMTPPPTQTPSPTATPRPSVTPKPTATPIIGSPSGAFVDGLLNF